MDTVGGGQTALKVFNKFKDKVHILITLDPVSWRIPTLPDKNSLQWINVVPELDFSMNSIISTIGRRWKTLPGACNVNIRCDHCSVDKMLDVKIFGNKSVWDVILSPNP